MLLWWLVTAVVGAAQRWSYRGGDEEQDDEGSVNLGVSNPRALPNLKVWDTGDIPSCSSLDDKVDSDSELDMSCKTNIKSVDIPLPVYPVINGALMNPVPLNYFKQFPDHVSTGFIYLSMSSSVITVPTGCSTSSEYQHWNVMEAEYFVKELQIGLKTTLLYPSIIIGSLSFFFFFLKTGKSRHFGFIQFESPEAGGKK
ncbi:hypothetical protein K1719_003468 [Acacia pycnantha]|nr:hypothetical protein K1719_003468 [Acacia pycnantha]